MADYGFKIVRMKIGSWGKVRAFFDLESSDGFTIKGFKIVEAITGLFVGFPSVKDKDGTIETLQRQLVQAGIKMKVGDAGNEIRKDVLETESQQKLLRGLMRAEFEKMRDQMKMDMESAKEDVAENE